MTDEQNEQMEYDYTFETAMEELTMWISHVESRNVSFYEENKDILSKK